MNKGASFLSGGDGAPRGVGWWCICIDDGFKKFHGVGGGCGCPFPLHAPTRGNLVSHGLFYRKDVSFAMLLLVST